MPGRVILLASAMLLALPAAAVAGARVAVRTGEHPGFGRIVLEASGNRPPVFRTQQEGTRLVLDFTDTTSFDLRAARRVPRNTTAIAATGQAVEITLRMPDARIRHRTLGNRIVVDVFDPPRTPNPIPAPTAQTPAAPPPSTDHPMVAATPETQRPGPRTMAGRAASGQRPAAAGLASQVPAAQAVQSQGASTTAAAAPATAEPDAPPAIGRPAGSAGAPASGSPAPLPAVPAALPAAADVNAAQPAETRVPAATLAPANALPVRLVFGTPGQPRSALLPFGEDTGIAILRRGETLLIVLDTPRPLNLAALRGDPIFGSMEARGVPGGVVLTLRLAPPAGLEARRRDGVWSLIATPGTNLAAPAVLEAQTDAPGPRLLVRTPHAGRIVAVADPDTGLPLLVGTVRAPELALSQLRRLPEGDLLPSLVGLPTLARSDRFALRATTEGFVLSGALALDPAVVAAEPPRAMTRLFDIPALSLPALTERLRAETLAARAAPPLGRAPLRRAAAETLLALGMPQEAQGMLALAASEDPRALDDPAIAALAGAAALLAGRVQDAEGLARENLPERDETILWRALYDAAQGDAQGAASRLAATLPLALAYPEALRSRLLGPIAETLAEAGHLSGLRHLAAATGAEPALTFARAALAEAEGRPAEALAGYEALTQGRDRRNRARALRRSIEIRLAAGTLTPAQAADALNAALFSWRGDQQELAARLRVAVLRSQAGDPRAAMALLRETETLFPEQAPALQGALRDAFLGSLEQESPLAAVALHDAEPGLLAQDARSDAALLGLAERLSALDLPERAAALLRPALARAAPGSVRRAELGLRLATLELGEGRTEPALSALRDSAADALPSDLAEARSLLTARAQARGGQRDAAVATLQAMGTAGAEALSEILAEARDWAGAARALAVRLPPAGGNTQLQDSAARTVLRQAALLGLAGNQDGITMLAAQFGGRFPAGPMADAFAALTADPMRGLADLPRLQRELRLFRALPGQTEPLRAASLGTR